MYVIKVRHKCNHTSDKDNLKVYFYLLIILKKELEIVI